MSPQVEFTTVAAVLVWLAFACVQRPYALCPDGTLCPENKICSVNGNRCVEEFGCGNGQVDSGETCDGALGERPESLSCLSYGFDMGHIACGQTSCQWDAVEDCRRLFGYDQLSTPATTQINAVWGRSAGDVWAVGNRETIVRSGSRGWELIKLDRSVENFNDVWGSATSEDLFVVGDFSTVFYYDGFHWSDETDGLVTLYDGEFQLRAVWGSGPDDVYVAGTGGLFARFDGANWINLNNGTITNREYYAIWGQSPDKLYIASEYAVISPQQSANVWQYRERIWSPLEECTTSTMRSGWEHGDKLFFGGDNGVICCQDPNGKVHEMTSGTVETIQAMWGTDMGDLFAVGEGGTALFFDANSVCEEDARWQAMNAGTNQSLYGVWADGSEVFAVGGNEDSALVSYHNGARLFRTKPDNPTRLLGAWDDGTGLVYVVGQNSELHRYQVRTRTFERILLVPDGGETLTAVWGSSPDTVYAVGYKGRIWRRSLDKSWEDHDPNSVISSATTLWDIHGNGPRNIYVVGATSERAVLARYDGETWKELDPGVSNKQVELRSVWVGASGDVFAVGSDSTIVRNEPTNPDAAFTPITASLEPGVQLNDVWQSDAGELFIVGAEGLIVFCDLSGDAPMCSQMSSGTDVEIHSVIGSNRDDVYAAGRNGTLLHYNGHDWAPINSRTAQTYRDVHITSPDRIVFVGDNEITQLYLPN